MVLPPSQHTRCEPRPKRPGEDRPIRGAMERDRRQAPPWYHPAGVALATTHASRHLPMRWTLVPFTLIGACATVLAAATAQAQSTDWIDKAYVNVNVALQLTARPVDEQLAPIIYSERAAIGASHAGSGGLLTLDVGGGVRLWRNLGAGATFTKFAAAESLNVTARVPSPTLFNQPRTASAVAPIERSDSAIHFQAVYLLPISPRIDLALSAGPSLISVQQDLISGIELQEAAPPATGVAIAKVATLTRQGTIVGVNAGADITFFLTPMLGVGATGRYARGTLATTLSDGRPVDLDAGGLQLGFGVRVRIK
jgi:hypothetical protein